MKPVREHIAHLRAARRARAQARREARMREAPSANMDRLGAEAGMATNDRWRAFGSIGGGDGGA